ncbi:hypothetical protein [Gallaecimonas xiamenensis]|uniref:hypothetical protein n=1 Tax=Gallaecimonas xiamenensis TaxID=1207039 RepID=UPI0004BA8578|nr:hypothetical protein [Gallaecimonas xiamenensis]
MTRLLLLTLLLLGACASTQDVEDPGALRQGEMIRVTLKDGRSLQGLYQGQTDELLMTSKGSVPLAQVAGIEHREGPQGEKANALAKLFNNSLLVAIGVLGLVLLL